MRYASILFVLGVLPLLSALGCSNHTHDERTQEVGEPASKQPKASGPTITVRRVSRKLGSAWNWKVYVNDEFVGKIGNGETRSFRFTPNERGLNKIYVEGYDLIFANRKTRVLEFDTDSIKEAFVDCGDEFT